MAQPVFVTIKELKPPLERARDAIAEAQSELFKMSLAANEGDHLEAAKHESEVSFQLSQLQEILHHLK